MGTKTTWWKPDGLTWYVLFIIALLVYMGLTGKLDTSPKPAETTSIPPLNEQEKKEVSDRYEQAIAEITANYRNHYHKGLLPHEALSIYMKCKTVNNYPPILREDHKHLLEYICPPNELMELTEAQKVRAAAEAKNAEKVRNFVGE